MKIWMKIAILLSGAVFTLALLIALAMRWVVVDVVQQQNLHSRVVVARTIADGIADFLLTNDHYRVDEIIQDAVRSGNGIEYIYATNLDGRIFSHTFPGGYPPDLLDWNPLGRASHSVQLLATEKGYIHDIGVRLFDGAEAGLHIGLMDAKLQHGLLAIRNTIFILTGLVVIAGVIASFLFSRFLTTPLEKLALFSQRLSQGEFGDSIPVTSNDEMGRLVGAFNSLSQELARYRSQMETSYQQMCTTEKLTAMSRLSAGLAHELRNPLTAIKVLFNTVGSKEEFTGKDLEMVRAEISHMDGILKRFLGVSRSEALDRREMDINELLENVLALLRIPLKNQNITLRFQPGPVPRFTANAPLIEQALLNLLINAQEAMPDGGHLTVRTECADNRLVLSIEDTGSGIQDSILANIYDPFITSKPEGTGLGLFLVKTIIGNQGGTIACQTSAQGTIFTVSLPDCCGETSHA